MSKLTLKDLSVKHPYYCSGCNYYSNDASLHFNNFADFYEEFNDADPDLNLVFRWDIIEREASERYYLELFIMKQRKGIFMPVMIDYIDDSDVDLLLKYLKPHMKRLKKMWKPLKF